MMVQSAQQQVKRREEGEKEEEEAEGQGQSPLPRHWWVVVVQAQTRCRQTDRQAGRERQAQ